MAIKFLFSKSGEDMIEDIKIDRKYLMKDEGEYGYVFYFPRKHFRKAIEIDDIPPGTHLCLCHSANDEVVEFQQYPPIYVLFSEETITIEVDEVAYKKFWDEPLGIYDLMAAKKDTIEKQDALYLNYFDESKDTFLINYAFDLYRSAYSDVSHLTSFIFEVIEQLHTRASSKVVAMLSSAYGTATYSLDFNHVKLKRVMREVESRIHRPVTYTVNDEKIHLFVHSCHGYLEITDEELKYKNEIDLTKQVIQHFDQHR
ncbi:hypothetical protein [Desertibacillus haloalkaliphilus]|uniref:hypothetical protein n=1 Tax=Desertibacillus haloalkaliphilus TaxID=1328930 RepID=UPI001C25D9F6|nr:hypothetical protein [Desertibacillus haloalkaliphilus]MBU8907964.1 hypothetical protein [Desertibacillus haloalkaliphilus]